MKILPGKSKGLGKDKKILEVNKQLPRIVLTAIVIQNLWSMWKIIKDKDENHCGGRNQTSSKLVSFILFVLFCFIPF